MPHPKIPLKSTRKRQLWSNRYRRLKEWVNSLPPLLLLRAEKFVQVFLKRKSLSLRLADNYLAQLWGGISRATVQRTLQTFEELGLLKRITQPPKKGTDGNWTQERRLVLLLPKRVDEQNSYLVSHSEQLPKLQENPVDQKSTQSVKQKSFVDYLYNQKRVSKGAWAYFLRTQQAEPRSFGYLLSSIYQRIQNRPDVLESILFDAEEQKLKGRQLVGYTVSEIKARVTM